MEVHHHSHSGPKKFKHYLWEFLMLFLAVFCGFLAENIREHIAEHKRARDYATSLYKDLQRDTLDLQRGILQQHLAASYIDSLCLFVKGPDAFSESGKLFMYMRLSNRVYSVEWSKATLDQLLNSGNLRYFTNHELTNKISEYNTLSVIISARDGGIIKLRHDEMEAWGKLFNAYYINKLLQIPLAHYSYPSGTQYDSLIHLQVPLVSKDIILLNEYVMNAMNSNNTTRNLADFYYPWAIRLAVEIMNMLKKEYNIK